MEKLIKKDLKNININWNNQKFTYDCLNDNLNLFLTDDNINKSFFNCKLEGFLTYSSNYYDGKTDYSHNGYKCNIYYNNILNEIINIIYLNKKYKINDLYNIHLGNKNKLDLFYEGFDYYIQLLNKNSNTTSLFLNLNEFYKEENEHYLRTSGGNNEYYNKKYQQLLNEQEKIDNEYNKNIKINLDKINIKNNNLNILFYIIYFLSHYKKYDINFINTYHYLLNYTYKGNDYEFYNEYIYLIDKYKLNQNNIIKCSSYKNEKQIDNYYYCVNINKEYNEEYNMEMELIFKNYKLKIKELNKYEILYDVINNDNSKYSFKKDNIIHSNIDYFDYLNEIILNYINTKEKYDEEIKYEDEYLDDYKNEDDKDENYIDELEKINDDKILNN